MFELIYKKIYLEHTKESMNADESLTRKIKAFLEEKKIENLERAEVEELVYVAGSIGHEEGFLCAVRFFKNFFSEMFAVN